MRVLFGKAAAVLLVAVAAITGAAYYNLIEASQQISVVRTFSSSAVAPGGELRVTIQTTGLSRLGKVEETLPAGFAYVGSDLPAAKVEDSGRTVAFFPFGDDRFTYRVSAPTRPDTYSFGTFGGLCTVSDVIGGIIRSLLTCDPPDSDFEVTVDATIPPSTTDPPPTDPPPPATDASLSSLSLTDGTGAAIALMDVDGKMVDFASGVTTYYAAVDNAVDMIDVMATATDENAAVSGTGATSLSEGENTVEVTVTSEDGTETGTYMVMVTREEMSDEARLLAEYDANGDDRIDLDEVNMAIDDYFDGEITLDEVNIVIDLYFM